ncbi:snare region anchored in the vesicle membrane C-terminus-domain-containing protein, partial [Chytriomyces sp. MP71]
QIHSGLETLRQATKDMEDIAKREMTTVKREKALARATSMRDEHHRLKSLFDDLRKQMTDKVTASQPTNQPIKLFNPFIPIYPFAKQASERDRPSLTDTSTILMMDGLLKENDSLTASDSRLDEFIQMGRGALNELYEQRQLLKSTQRRLYDIANSLGLSSTVIKYIEKRATQDRWVLFGGMAATLLLMWGIAHFFGRKAT